MLKHLIWAIALVSTSYIISASYVQVQYDRGNVVMQMTAPQIGKLPPDMHVSPPEDNNEVWQ